MVCSVCCLEGHNRASCPVATTRAIRIHHFMVDHMKLSLGVRLRQDPYAYYFTANLLQKMVVGDLELLMHLHRSLLSREVVSETIALLPKKRLMTLRLSTLYVEIRFVVSSEEVDRLAENVYVNDAYVRRSIVPELELGGTGGSGRRVWSENFVRDVRRRVSRRSVVDRRFVVDRRSVVDRHEADHAEKMCVIQGEVPFADDDCCPICLEELESYTVCMMKECGHKTCLECASKCMKGGRLNCCLCRTVVSTFVLQTLTVS
jgi:hypothetical protein